jgi:hypothetical protein
MDLISHRFSLNVVCPDNVSAADQLLFLTGNLLAHQNPRTPYARWDRYTLRGCSLHVRAKSEISRALCPLPFSNRLYTSVPRWSDWTAVGLTIFLLWFAISQFGLLLHGLNLRQGGDPLVVLRRRPVPELPAPVEPADLQPPRSSLDEST